MMYEASLAKGVTVDQTLTIVDATGIKLSALTKTVLSTFAKMTKLDQDYYPESNALTIVTNAGYFFAGVFKVKHKSNLLFHYYIILISSLYHYYIITI
jgi:hypothetical protein